ncbi:malto-oligosyltrehalose trehalohydrolase [Sulfidibacter corallicola]|uniref:Malto-oligosyltrehalose trehalohydrolase n=1 Tax=Sulfidibacter corallicola TaxID=2818388 RepID=A0A8A4TDV6_SULCO|nr:malto-oligosyltrehalose trehalohydrolase [Sulfidibacter corallicola]QTD47747.1 malto-oligosyltrehalose trehalohydrolase [Sulfidibacter corallicola]
MNFSHGAVYSNDGRTRFRVWAPHSDEVWLVAENDRWERPLGAEANGYFSATFDDCPPGFLYRYRLDEGAPLPDPASFCQPDGVHGPSMVVDHHFSWQCEKRHDEVSLGNLKDALIYELHVGTFTREGTLEAAAEKLPILADLGITAVELLPLSAFPGDRNWGYDGVFPYAVPACYGTFATFRRFVERAHDLDLSVILDVVYNHLGPEGNYFSRFGPYYSERFKTPWGAALNFDGPHCDPVCDFFIENALFWLRECRVDGLRLDAIDEIVDTSAKPFLESLAEQVYELSRETGHPHVLIGESNANDPRFIIPRERGGIGLDAVWIDDFHHALHAYFTGEREGYYADFGSLRHVKKTLRKGTFAPGGYRTYRKRNYGRDFGAAHQEQLVVYTQNHDQTGNRPKGERLHHLIGVDRAIQAAALTILSPYTPMLFMGEEYAADQPFLFFTNHGDPTMIKGMRKGRNKELREFGWREKAPDPQDPETRESCILDFADREQGVHAQVFAAYRSLMHLRRQAREMRLLDHDRMTVTADEQGHWLRIEYRRQRKWLGVVVNTGEKPLGLGDILEGEAGEAIWAFSEERFHGNWRETTAAAHATIVFASL